MVYIVTHNTPDGESFIKGVYLSLESAEQAVLDGEKSLTSTVEWFEVDIWDIDE